MHLHAGRLVACRINLAGGMAEGSTLWTRLERYRVQTRREEHEEEPNEGSEALKKRRVQGADPAPEDLQALGLKGGPSILAVPEPQENSNPGWEW